MPGAITEQELADLGGVAGTQAKASSGGNLSVPRIGLPFEIGNFKWFEQKFAREGV